MAEPLDRRTQIMDAALAEFAAKGFRGATIKSIAEAARLRSPALIYWYFPDKDSLFRAVLGAHAPILQAVEAPAAIMERPPEEVLPMLARALLATASDPVAQQLIRMVLCEGTQREELAATFLASGPLRVLDVLAAYLTRQIDLGRLRPHDSATGARAFAGMLLPQALSKGLLPGVSAVVPDEDYIASVVAIFLGGLQAVE